MKRGLLSLLIVLTACQRAPMPTPPSAAPTEVISVAQVYTPQPTHTPKPLFASPTPSLTAPPATQPPATSIPTQMPISNATVVTVAAPPISFATIENLQPPTSIALPNPASGDAEIEGSEHFIFDWPIPLRGPYTLNRVYPYGGTDNNQLQVHHGVDLVNPLGTPIHAAADGTVFYAGNDFNILFGAFNNYYGNLVVIQHNFTTTDGQPIYTLYGHMSQVEVQAGQIVHDGDEIGLVGATGIALGPHVHFEVRIGNPYDFGATRNPELWLRPLNNTGVLAGRVTDANGNLVYNISLSVQSRSLAQKAYTYGDSSVNSDPVLGENFTLGNLPEDDYVVQVIDGGRLRFQNTIHVAPNALTWLNVVLSP
ncbi:MAG TPA: peptidoglycan DD-metalloendopeptidase family protein [Phototrophicaceae bacterium]|nr:peptidoglycan DD-metalloendopeptidase family protein [Phototrophicaceae bacterium]